MIFKISQIQIIDDRDVIIVIIAPGGCGIIIQVNKEKSEEYMVDDAGYFIHNTQNINTIIDEDESEG